MQPFAAGEPSLREKRVAELGQPFEKGLNRRISGLGLEATVETTGIAGIGLYAVVSGTATGEPLPAHLRKQVLAKTKEIAPDYQYGGFNVYIVARARDE